MSRRANRKRRSGRPPYGGLLPWTLSLPARLHVRGLVILAVMVVVMGAYGRVLVTAPPMPPSKVPPAETATHVPTGASPMVR